MKFYIVKLGAKEIVPSSSEEAVVLYADNWNDYSFITLFFMRLYKKGKSYDLGNLRIGYEGQLANDHTSNRIDSEFISIGKKFFSLGMSVEYYKSIHELGETGEVILNSLNDLVMNQSIIDSIDSEDVFNTSLLRDCSLTTIKGEYARVLSGQDPLSNYSFRFKRNDGNGMGGIDLTFNVTKESTPSSNLHALVGKNGIGKTTILNGMIKSVTGNDESGRFYTKLFGNDTLIDKDYFSRIVSVSFSAFDPFLPPPNQSDPAKGTCYFYVGLKDVARNNQIKSIEILREDCTKALMECFRSKKKTESWLRGINKLGMDVGFLSMKLHRLYKIYLSVVEENSELQPDSLVFMEQYYIQIQSILNLMSSGHAIVILTITELVSRVEEKTLVLLDEPESHLHPPLLSAFIRSLSELLLDRNGVAIIATHSPVVLQEIPKSCVWKIIRKGTEVRASRPKKETFGENIGVITDEIFGLMIEKSGFINELNIHVMNGLSYDEILEKFGYQLGIEGRSILKVLIADRENIND